MFIVTQALLVMRNFKLYTLITVVALFSLHIIAFTIMYVLVTGVQETIIDLNSSGKGSYNLRLSVE